MDEQVELLRGIWNEMNALNGRVETTNERLVCVERGLATTNEKLVDLEGGLSTRLDLLRDEMHSGFRGFSERTDAVHERSVRGDLRIATSLATLTSEVREMKEIVLVWHDEHRADRANLAERVDRLERHVGLSRG
jgi:hypothetical protein